MKKILVVILICVFGRSSIAQYSWDNVGPGMNSTVHALAADTTNDILYAGGIFTLSGLTPVINVAKWDGSSWSPIGGGILSGLGISSLLVDGTDLIAGGTFTNIGGILSKNVARWDGISWNPIGAGLEYTGLTTVSTLTIYNGDLYAGGTFALSGSTLVSNIARWDGAAWQPLGSGINGPVRSLCVYGTELYAGGSFTNAGGVSVNNIAKWDGTTWTDVGGGVSYTGLTNVSTLTVYNGDLYAGGTFTTAGSATVKHLAKWDGSSWSDAGGGAGSYTGATTVATLTVFNNELIVGGNMDSLGSIPVNNIGKWDGTTWTTMGSGADNSVAALAAMHDTLYAGGSFLTTDGIPTPFVAQWIPGGMSLATGFEETTAKPGWLLYPNPAESRIYIRTELTFEQANYTLTLSDLTGREVFRRGNISREVIFDRSGIAGGLYLYRICKDNNTVVKGKISLR